MFCIAAFIVFLILGIFSARYRKIAKKAWFCVVRKITFRPCTIGFKEDAKNILLGKLILTKPKLAKFLDKWIEVFATIFVVLSVWSLLVVFQSGLNLFVYDTCYPKNVESCSLGGEACGVSTGAQTFFEAVKNLELLTWAKDETVFLGKTISMIPDRFKNWQPEEYLDENATYYSPFDPQKKVALEIIDPGCKFCAKLWRNIKTAQFEYNYNLTYIPYAIPEISGGFKFPNSPLVISYLESMKIYPLDTNISEVPADWQILEKLFLDKTPEGALYQENFNFLYSSSEAEAILIGWLKEIGYSDGQIEKIQTASKSSAIKEVMEKQVKIVEDEIRTIKIPTIIFDERRYDRVIDPEKLN